MNHQKPKRVVYRTGRLLSKSLLLCIGIVGSGVLASNSLAQDPPEYELYTIVHGQLGDGTIEPSRITATASGGRALFAMHVDGHDEQYDFVWSFSEDLIRFRSMTNLGKPETIYPELGAAKTNGISTSNEGKITAGGTWENLSQKEIMASFTAKSGIPVGDVSWVSTRGDRIDWTDGSGNDELISIRDAGAGKEFTAIRIDFEVEEADSSGTVDYQVIYVFRRIEPVVQPVQPLYRLHQIAVAESIANPFSLPKGPVIVAGDASPNKARCTIAYWNAHHQADVEFSLSVEFNFENTEYFMGDEVNVRIDATEDPLAPYHSVNVGDIEFQYNLRGYDGARALDSEVTPTNSNEATGKRIGWDPHRTTNYSLTDPTKNFLPLENTATPEFFILPVTFEFLANQSASYQGVFQVLYVFKRTLTQYEKYLGVKIRALKRQISSTNKKLRKTKSPGKKKRFRRKSKKLKIALRRARWELQNFQAG